MEQGDSDTSVNSASSLMVEATVASSQATTPSHSQVTTSGLNSPMAEIALSSQESTTFFRSPTTSVLRKRGGRPCKVLTKFRGNQFTNREEASISLDEPSDAIPPKSKRIQYTE